MARSWSLATPLAARAEAGALKGNELKVLQVNNYGFVRGGSDRYFLDLSNLLAQHGHQLTYLCSADPRNVVDSRYAVQGITIERPTVGDVPKFMYSLAARRMLEALLAAERPDIAHLHIYYGQISPSILGVLKAHAIPVVQTLHEYKLLCPIATMVKNGRICEECGAGGYWRAAWHRCNRGGVARSLVTACEAYLSRLLGTRRLVDHFLAVSDFVRQTMIRQGIPSERITTVHNFIDGQRFRPSHQEGDYFLYFGRLETIKGVMTLLEAARRTSAKLVVAGDGTARALMEETIRQQGLTQVTLVGFKRGEELHDLIRGCRCVIVPSEWYETFGLVILEANALGKPVIASRIGGMPEVVREGVTGLLVEPGDVTMLAQALDWMWNHPAEAVAMGRAGCTWVAEEFGPERHYQEMMAIYQKLTAQGPGQGLLGPVTARKSP